MAISMTTATSRMPRIARVQLDNSKVFTPE
jgi:hypothetical protein